MPENVKKTILENGLVVISERIPTVRSVSVGLWVKTGSRFEQPHENGIAHFLEHMVFKGTEKRSSLQIARALEELGGSLNAGTSRELTLFNTHSLDTHLAVSISILTDMICNPLLDGADVENERQVILEEIQSVKDTPEEYIFDLFTQKLFPDQAVGHPILGTEETISKISKSTLSSFWHKYFSPQNIIICAAGNIKHDRLVKHVQRNCRFRFPGTAPAGPAQKPKSGRNINHSVKDHLNQAHLCIGTEGIPFSSNERLPLIALNLYLGDGMSSRLFQVIREKYGLAYSVYSQVDFLQDTGIINFYIGTNPSNQEQVLELLKAEIHKLRKEALKKTVVEKLIEQLKGTLLLGLESTYRRMIRLARNEIYFQRHKSIDEILDEIKLINADSLLEISQNIFNIDEFNIIRLVPHA